MAERTPRVLDVGQCDMDHGAIAGMLQREFGAAVDRAHTAEEALAGIERERYDLVLTNRIFDRDGADGLGLIRRIKTAKRAEDVPVMLVSNYAEAQAAAVEAGAAPGFGKAAMNSPGTVALLRDHLRTRAPKT